MATLGRLWAGRVFGTNTGNLFLELESSEGVVSGTARFMDPVFGLTVYRVSGTYGDSLQLSGEPTQVQPDTAAGNLDVTARLTPDGSLRGEWRSTLGTAGTFEAFPHDQPSAEQKPASGIQSPEQIFTSSIPLGALRLFAKDVWSLAAFIKKDFVVGRLIATYSVRGNEVSRYFEDFEHEAPSLGELRRIKLMIQEPDAHGINKVVTVDIDAAATNEVRVQGVNESWVVGKAEALARTLRRHEKGFVTTYRKFGLTLNQLIFFAMLVFIPAIASIQSRALFVGVVAALMAGLVHLHNRYIPNALLYLSAREPSTFERWKPALASWLIAATASLAAALVFWWLTRGNAG